MQRIDPNTFRRAVEARDLETMISALAENVVFNSPARFEPFDGKAAVGALLSTLVTEVFDTFEYLEEFVGEDGGKILLFKARVGDKAIEGIDLLRFDETGRIEDFSVMLRPKSAISAVSAALAQHLGNHRIEMRRVGNR